MVTNNTITEITHLTGFDLSPTFRGQLDHIDSFNFNDSWSLLFGFLTDIPCFTRFYQKPMPTPHSMEHSCSEQEVKGSDF